MYTGEKIILLKWRGGRRTVIIQSVSDSQKGKDGHEKGDTGRVLGIEEPGLRASWAIGGSGPLG